MGAISSGAASPATTVILPSAVISTRPFTPAFVMALSALTRSDCRKCCRARDISAGCLLALFLVHAGPDRPDDFRILAGPIAFGLLLEPPLRVLRETNNHFCSVR